GATDNNWVIVDADGSLNNASGAAGATTPMLSSEYSTTIINAHQLQLMAMKLSASYTLANNIDAWSTNPDKSGGAGSDVWGSAGFVPVGNAANNFTGTLDGAGHIVGSLTITSQGNNAGLFGVVGAAGVIQNVGLINLHPEVIDLAGIVSGSGTVGGLVGKNNGSVINSYSELLVFGSSGSTGGLVGYNNGHVTDSHVTATIYGGADTGGLVGRNGAAGDIQNSYAEYGVQGYGNSGGLVGTNDGAIANSYAVDAAVSGVSSAGGLVGL